MKERLAFSLRKELPVSTRARYLIKFKHGDLACLRARLVAGISREPFAVLLGKIQEIDGYTIIKVIDLLFLAQSDYNQQSVAFLRIKKDFIHKALVELTNRYDVDTIIDVHTHPFSQGSVSFSATDDGDEQTFFLFLNDKFEGIHYASIVLSQSMYAARVWTISGGSIVARRALLKTQTSRENIASADFREATDERYEKAAASDVEGFFDRSALALGLDAMRTIMHHQVISIVGVGGLGSVIAEHRIHMGFHEI